jgi:phosphatidylglycerophosphatase A
MSRLSLQRWIGSVGGIGYMGKGGGTVAAAVCALVLFGASALAPDSGTLRWIVLPVVTVVLTVLGIWSGNGVEAGWGKDSSKVVMDEVVGMLVTVLFQPLRPLTLLIGLLLFRFFDIVKPLGIRQTEALPGGWGVMVDDIVAGVYAGILLMIGAHFKWF